MGYSKLGHKREGVCTSSTFAITPTSGATAGAALVATATVAYTGTIRPIHTLWKKEVSGSWTSIGPQVSPTFNFALTAGNWSVQIWSKMPSNPAAIEVSSSNNAYIVT